jgi:hypothetical protein
LRSLLDEALTQPNTAGMIIDARTTQVYAVTRAALDAGVLTQRRPVRRQNTPNAIAKSVIAVPAYVHAVAHRADALNNDRTPVGRAFAFSGFILCFFGSMFLFTLMKKLSVDPIYDFLRSTEGLKVFDSVEMAIVFPQMIPLVGGLVVSLAAALAWTPTFAQHLSFVLGGTQPWIAWMFWLTTVFDVAVNTRFWIKVSFPMGYPAGYGMVPDMLITLGITASMVIISVVVSIGTEFIIGLLAATAWALRKGAAAAVRDLIMGIISTVVGTYYGAVSIASDARDVVADKRNTHLLGGNGGVYEVVEVVEGVYEEAGVWQ